MISSIKISNFKSIIDATAKLPHFGAIVGLNAAGKSNLIISIELTKLLIAGNVDLSILADRYVSVPEELFNLRDNSPTRPFSFEFEISAESDAKYLFGISIALKKNPNTASTLVVDQEYLKKVSNGSDVLIYKRNSDGSIQTNGEVIPPTINISNDKLFIPLYETPDTDKVKQVFRNIRLQSSDVKNLRSPGVFLNGNEVSRSDRISNLVGRVMKDTNLYGQFLKIIKTLMPNFSDFKEIKIDTEKIKGNEFMILMQENSLQRELSSRSFSEGDLRTFAIIATALEAPSGSAFFIEEVENGMHPGRAEKLVEYLDTFSKVKDIQIVFSTHSPLVINELKPHNILFVSKNGHGTEFELLSDSEDITRIKALLKEGGSVSDYLSTKLSKRG